MLPTLYSQWLRHLRHRLAHSHTLLAMSILGVVAGLSCGLIMFAFHHAISILPSLLLPGGDSDNFEGLARWQHFALPVCGALTIGLILKKLPAETRRTGVPHVISRLHGHHGHLPARNTLVQFFLGALALGSGQSGGREGPSIHLGAGINSLIGQQLKLPNNSIRVLVGCGTAAAIAAAFNTPIAGVIFAMEVVMMEYTIAGFIPVMLATVTATAFTRAVGIDQSMFDNPVTQMTSLLELPYIVCLGLAVGCCASLFIIILKKAASYGDKPVEQRMLVAGLVTGCCALAVPQILGLGYDSFDAAISADSGFYLLLALVAAKLLATAVSCGLGMPIGLIGPNLLIGACLGSALGTLGNHLNPELASHQGFYALLGMGAMMGAVLNAPLAALMALVELTHSTSIIFPAMLAIIVATLTNTELFKQQSATQSILTLTQVNLRTDALTLTLQRSSAASIMDRQVALSPQRISQLEAEQLLAAAPRTLVSCDPDDRLHCFDWSSFGGKLKAEVERKRQDHIDLLSLDDEAKPAASLHIQATLHEALDLMNSEEVDIIYISGYISGPYADQGIITRATILQQASKPQ